MPWYVLPLQIILYKINILKDVEDEAKDIAKYEFGTEIIIHMIHMRFARTIV